MDFMKRYEAWVSDPNIDERTKAELLSIADDKAEIEDRFYKDLEFGTAGLRGVIGAGTNRMNKYTVGKASYGLASFIKKQGDAAMERGVAIAYDSRNMSPEFADYSALVLAANGVRAYVFDGLRPTPELSFAVRHLNAVAGIVITASHNPAAYNGYKVYWEDGAQVSDPYDKLIMAEVNSVADLSHVRFADKDDAVKSGLYRVIGREVDDAYVDKVLEQIQNKDALLKNAGGLNVVYTPLHGTGGGLVPNVLKKAGFTNVFVVPEQEKPDGSFSTVGYPNPEDPNVFKLGIALAEKQNADMVIATDPDADRVGAVVKNEKGEYVIITGNMSGTLLTHFILDSKKAAGTLPKDGVVIKTIVSTGMVDAVCEDYGVSLVEVLTGFKFIGKKIKEYELTGKNTYIFGFEESYGCLLGTYARDKDAVLATMLLCELAASLKARGKTLYDGLLELYNKYGWFKESVVSVSLEGAEGARRMSAIMDGLRKNPPAEIGGRGVVSISDYKLSKKTDLKAKDETKIELPVSDVLKLELDDGSWFCARPSGTEPKIKFYMGVRGGSEKEADEKTKLISEAVDLIAKNV